MVLYIETADIFQTEDDADLAPRESGIDQPAEEHLRLLDRTGRRRPRHRNDLRLQQSADANFLVELVQERQRLMGVLEGEFDQSPQQSQPAMQQPLLVETRVAQIPDNNK